MSCCTDHKPATAELPDSPSKRGRKNGTKGSQRKKPSTVRTQQFRHLTDDKLFLQELTKSIAPKTFRERYVAGRSSRNKKFNVRWLKNKHIPLSHETIFSYLSFVETLFSAKYQFPMLVTMLSLRLDIIDPTDITDCLWILQGSLVPASVLFSYH